MALRPWPRSGAALGMGIGLALALGACGHPPSAPAQVQGSGLTLKMVGQGSGSMQGQAGPKEHILLLHGHQGSSANWAAMVPFLRAAGFEPLAVDLATEGWSDWTFQSLAEQLAVHHRALVRRSGQAKVNLVAHSLGGLIARQYLKFLGGDALVDRLVCLGSPHHGVGHALLGPWLVVGQAFRPHSPQLNALNRPDETHGSVQYTNLWSTGDYMEWVPYASGRLEGAFNVKTHGTSHGAMTSDPKLFPEVVASLRRSLEAMPGPEREIP